MLLNTDFLNKQKKKSGFNKNSATELQKKNTIFDAEKFWLNV